MDPFLTGGEMIQLGRARAHLLERAALEVRGRHAGDRRERRHGRRDRLPAGDRHGRASRPTRSGSRRTPTSGSRPSTASHPRPAGRPSAAASISFTFARDPPARRGPELDRYGICVRAGHHCTQPAMQPLRRPRDDPGELLPVHHPRGDRPALRRARGRPRGVRHDGRAARPRVDPRPLQEPAQLRRARPSPTPRAEGQNPLCGDEQHVDLRLRGRRASTEIRFRGHGCSISTAATSMLTEDVAGQAGRGGRRDDARRHHRPGRHPALARAPEVRAARARRRSRSR